jgi:hypothetical protein
MEASMHGSFDRSGESNKRFHRNSGIGLFALPLLIVIALIGLAITRPAASIWISQAVQAEFVGTDLVPDISPVQIARPAMTIRTVKLN